MRFGQYEINKICKWVILLVFAATNVITQNNNKLSSGLLWPVKIIRGN